MTTSSSAAMVKATSTSSRVNPLLPSTAGRCRHAVIQRNPPGEPIDHDLRAAQPLSEADAAARRTAIGEETDARGCGIDAILGRGDERDVHRARDLAQMLRGGAAI